MKRVRDYLLATVAIMAVLVMQLAKSGRAPDETQVVEQAESPADLSKKGWKAALLNTKTALKDKELSRAAAALAYYATLSFFPVMLGSAALYASIDSPQALRSSIDSLQGIVPNAIYTLIDTQLSPLAEASRGSTIVATVISILALLWTMSGGLQNLVKTMNLAYDRHETRNFIKLWLVSVLLSVGLLFLGGLALIMILLQGDALQRWGFPHLLAVTFPYLRWLVLAVIITIALAFIYRYAPDRENPRWQWVSRGAGAASAIWLTTTLLFFVYAQNFSNFNETYGIFAGLVVLMTWFNLSALIILVGAQVNKKLEDVTSKATE